MPAVAGARDVLSGPPKRIGTKLMGTSTVGEGDWATGRDVIDGHVVLIGPTLLIGTFLIGGHIWTPGRDSVNATAGARDIL